MTFPSTILSYISEGAYGERSGGIGIGYWLIIGVTVIVSLIISGTLKRRFHEYSQLPLSVTGAQVAEAMLRQNGIVDVQVVSVPGELTDHYDPAKKTVNLSEYVYGANTVAAAAVAAHECGHAVQHKQAYAWLDFRSKMVPAVQIASSIQQFVIPMAIAGFAFFASPTMLWVAVGLLAVTTLFSVVTLPVEFDASRRAMVWLEKSGLANRMEHEKAKNALFWAAMTYVAGAVGSVATLLYMLSAARGSSRN